MAVVDVGRRVACGDGGLDVGYFLFKARDFGFGFFDFFAGFADELFVFALFGVAELALSWGG